MDQSERKIAFLSTPSARRATAIVRSCASFLPYFYPRPPRGGRRGPARTQRERFFISIHALREEGDTSRLPERPRLHHFYPRPPRGGRRKEHKINGGTNNISIHALREEGDPLPGRTFPSPGGFLSTPSARRATCPESAAKQRPGNFYPRPPRGGRP